MSARPVIVIAGIGNGTGRLHSKAVRNFSDCGVHNRYWGCYSVSLLVLVIERHRSNIRTVASSQRKGTE